MTALRDALNRMDSATAVMLICVVLFTLVAAVSDLRTRRIPNRLTLPMCLAGLVYQLAFFRLDGLVTALAGFSAGFGIFFVLWMIGTAGGGDVKLMGALGPWLGAWMILKVMFVSLLFVTIGTAGIVLFSLIRRGLRRTKAQYLKTASDGRTGETIAQRQHRRVMAFAAPVALATWCVLAFQMLQQARP
jgi:prepilin peptidase CpaA